MKEEEYKQQIMKSERNQRKRTFILLRTSKYR